MGIGQLGGYSAMRTTSAKMACFHELELHIDNKILTTYDCRTKNYNKISDMCRLSVLLGF